MNTLSADFARPCDVASDLKDVGRLDAFSAILDVVCTTTGLGFATIARAMDERWIACSIRDVIGLGIQPSDELKLDSIIKHRTRHSRSAVVIDDADARQTCRDGLPAVPYGLRSGICMPIVLANGTFWGALYAGGLQPAELNTPQIQGMAKGFTDLIAWQLDATNRTPASVAAHQQQNFQMSLERLLQGESDPVAIIEIATAALGRQLGADQVGFAEIDESQTWLTVEREWNAGRTGSVVGTWRLDDFSSAFSARMKAGMTTALSDVQQDPMTSQPPVVAAYSAISTRAILDVPLIRAGRMVAMLFIHCAEPRSWSDEHIALVERTCMRLWTAVENARAESKLRKSEERLRAIFANASVGLSEVTLQGRFLRVNTELCRMLGRSEDELLSLGTVEVTHPDDLHASLAVIAQALKTGISVSIDKRYTRPDGTLIWANSNVQRLDDNGQQASSLLVATVDLTRRKDAEEALRASEEFNRRILASSADCIKVLDLDARLEFMSEGGMCVMEVDDFSAIQGACWPDLWRGDEHAKAKHAVEEAKQGRFGRFQGFATTMKGNARWWDVIVTPITGPHGLPEKLLSISRDVTSSKQAEVRLQELNETLEERVLERTADLLQAQEALRQAQKMEAVGQLTGGLAHDFNNLLAGISGSLEMMQARLNQGRLNDVNRYLGTAQGAATRAAALTHRLLAFSRRQTLDPKPTNVNRLIAGMEEMIRRTVGPSIHIDVVGARDLWSALVDPPQLENALLNLCINARDAMPDGGRITITTTNQYLDGDAARRHDTPQGHYLSLSVTDTGVGMPPQVMARVFEPFFTTKPLGAGTGLGLSMIYGFAHQSGGRVQVESEVGNGATVSIYLPRHHASGDDSPGPIKPEKVMPSEQGETVLVVDDEPSVRMLVTDILADLGYTAIEAADSIEGLAILRSDVRIDLLVTDVGLPGGMNGRQMAEAGRQTRAGLKVLFITGYAENSVLGSGRLANGMSVLTKPFAVDAMAVKIRKILAS
ncbi:MULTISPECIES: PAS domain S-box protein [unclassified Pseudomonas]|uniref:PAS domain S-box protein n=1 Tax=unclassified Pseudomonas TaxID=196821 RepID=UPI0025E51B05|nr:MULTISPECIES: PAS domain S-box protein [unclassified Pseudomonas]